MTTNYLNANLFANNQLTFASLQSERNVSEGHIAFGDHDGHTPVILGEVGDEPLLGVITLESLG